MSEYLSSFDADEREMKKYIIGTISRLDAPLTPPMKGERADINYFINLQQSEIQRERDEILGTRAEDIKGLAAMAKDVMKNEYICVLGGEGKIRQNKDLFKKLINVFE
jgi:Zn-dependent M16 (insulinase) family peptidase